MRLGLEEWLDILGGEWVFLSFATIPDLGQVPSTSLPAWARVQPLHGHPQGFSRLEVQGLLWPKGPLVLLEPHAVGLSPSRNHNSIQMDHIPKPDAPVHVFPMFVCLKQRKYPLHTWVGTALWC